MRDSASWPALPYRGLDFYEEAHAVLFRERDRETLSCVRLLSTFNVKILILQGSSGAGKSSFLRAGLIPALKRLSGRRPDPRWRAVFLNSMHGVIRCTSDPTSAVAAAITAALDEPTIFEGVQWPRHASDEVEVAISDMLGVPPRNTLAVVVPEDALPHDGNASFGFAHDEKTRSELRNNVAMAREAVRQAAGETAAQQAYKELAKTLVNVLAKLCSDSDYKLFLILDQAEEALTRTTGTQRTSPAAAGFFYFLEELYVRNLNLRVVVSLRTEYYGRFRDEFRISDLRLGERPDDGGVEPFLLRPIRDEEALIKAFEYPTKARTHDGKPAYPFRYEEGLLPKIVDDVLRLPELGNGSVTPLISMACAFLHGKLPHGVGELKRADYPGILEILGDYLKRGLAAVAGDGIKIRSAWLELLYSTLVSRQGGGTVVSLTETTDAFRRQAHINEFEIREDRVRPALVLLTTGTTPLLRGEPPGPEPIYFSLKHDALAVILDRRHTEYLGSAREAERAERERIRAEREQAKARQARYGLIGTVVLAGIIAAALFEWANISKQQQLASDETAAREIAGSSRLRDSYAARPLASDFRQSLLVLLANLESNEAGAKTAPRNAEIYDKSRLYTLASLRNLLVRVPWIVGRYAAVGLDPRGKQLALLRRRSSDVLVIPIASAEAKKHSYMAEPLTLPPGWEREQEFGAPAVGFLDGMGVAVYNQGSLFLWDGKGLAEKIDLRPALGDLATGFPEFTGGRLIIRKPPKAGFTSGGPLKWDLVRLDAELLRKIRSNPSESIGPARVDLPPQSAGSSIPSLSDAHDEYFAMVSEDHVPITCSVSTTSNRCDLPRLSTPVRDREGSFQTASLIYGELGQPPSPPLAIGLSPFRGFQEVRPFTFAFVAGVNTVAVKGDGANVWLHDLAATRDGDGSIIPKFVLGSFPDKVAELQALQLSAAAGSWLAAPFAVSHAGGHWSAAWIAESGLWAAASTEPDPAHAKPVSDGTLRTGEPGGISLKYTDDGAELLLVQQPRWGGPYVVRLWDLRPEWSDWIRNQAAGPDEAELMRLSCAILRSEKGRTGASSRPMELDPYELNVFQINEAFKAPCGEDIAPVGEEP